MADLNVHAHTPDGLDAIALDSAAEIRFTRLAMETTGYTRRVMLRLADAAHERALRAVGPETLIDLHLVPNLPGSLVSGIRTWG